MKMKLMLAQAALFLVVISIFSIILSKEKGAFLFYPYIEKKITTYYDEHYQNLTGIKKKDLNYNKKENSYSITYYHQKTTDLNFSITYKKGKITSNYKESYQKGRSLLKIREEKIKKELEKVFLDSDFKVKNVSFYPLTAYLKEEEKYILKEKNLKNSKLYIIKINKNTKDLENIEQNISKLSTLLNSNNIVPEKIILTLKKREESRTITLEKGEDNLWKNVYSAKS